MIVKKARNKKKTMDTVSWVDSGIYRSITTSFIRCITCSVHEFSSFLMKTYSASLSIAVRGAAHYKDVTKYGFDVTKYRRKGIFLGLISPFTA